MKISLTSVVRMLVLFSVGLGSDFQESEVGHLQRPATVDDAVRGLQVTMTTQLAVVQKQKAL